MSPSRFSPTTFMVAFCGTYAAAFFTNLPLFLYYPLHDNFSWGWHALKGIGPGMAWYGFMADSFIVAGVAAWCIPERLAYGVFRNCLWLVPVAAMIVCLYLLRIFFLR